MKLESLRKKLDGIDEQIVALCSDRMEVCKDIAAYKKENGLAVYDPERERKKMSSVVSMTDEDKKKDVFALYSLMMDLSKAYQSRQIGESGELGQRVKKAMEETEKEFPSFPSVACQGIEGANSQAACDRLFDAPNIMHFKSFDAVFSAIEQGLCQYGVLPVENSTAGSVNQVYDLMMEHKFYIVRSVRVKINHCLLVNPGTKKSDIREIVSHEQAIWQCENYIDEMGDVKITQVDNTAMAAKLVSESGRNDIAAISSHNCEGIYNLECINENIQDKGSNFTRFICISKNLEIYPGADKTSIMAVAKHQPGALYKILSHFYALGMNLTKLESRPLPDRDFEFMFYFDLEKSVYSPDFVRMLDELENICDHYEYLGSYSEVI